MSRSLAQMIGTRNDATASMSWEAGEAVAEGADYAATVGAFVTNSWKFADMKEKRLWPNKSGAGNHTNRRNLTDYNYQFISPGFIERSKEQ